MMGAKVASCNSNGHSTHMKLPMILEKAAFVSRIKKTGHVLKEAVNSCPSQEVFSTGD